jgi:hypothetical protein
VRAAPPPATTTRRRIARLRITTASPPEMEKAKNSSEDTESKGHPTSDRENMETAVLKQKPRQS